LVVIAHPRLSVPLLEHLHQGILDWHRHTKPLCDAGCNGTRAFEPFSQKLTSVDEEVD